MAGTPRASNASGRFSTTRDASGFEESLRIRLSLLQGSIVADYNRHSSVLQAEVQSLKEEIERQSLKDELQRLQKQLLPISNAGEDSPSPISSPFCLDGVATGEDAGLSSMDSASLDLQKTETSSMELLGANLKHSSSMESYPSSLKKSGSVEGSTRRNSLKSNVSFKEDEPVSPSNRGSLKSNISAASFLALPLKSPKGRRSKASSVSPAPRGSTKSNQQHSSTSSLESQEKRKSRRSGISNFFRASLSGSPPSRRSQSRSSTRSNAAQLQDNRDDADVSRGYYTMKISHVRTSRQSVETLDGVKISRVPTDSTTHSGTQPNCDEIPAGRTSTDPITRCEADGEQTNNTRYSSLDENEVFFVHQEWVKREKRKKSFHLASTSTADLSTMGNIMWNDHGLEQNDDEPQWKAWEKLVSHVMLKPTSPFRMLWDMVGFVFIVWDTIMLPLEFFKPEETGFIIVMTWVVRIYWSTDFPLSFLTGYDRPEGSVEIRPSYVARKYFQTWFIFDVAIITFDWLEMAVEGMKGLAALRMGKIGKAVRLLRMVRLLRVLKLSRGVGVPEVVRLVFYKMSSERVSIFLGMVRMILFLAGVVHFIACCWYGIGGDGSEPNWIDSSSGIRGAEFKYVYMTTFHWALTQFAGSMDIQPYNFGERLFAVAALLFGFIFAAFVVSSITSSMTRLQIVMARQSTQVSMLNHYLWDNGISAKLALRVQRNAMHAAAQDARNTPEEEIELLHLVSEPLQVELHYEIYCPSFQRHPFFNFYKEKNLPAMRRICHSATSRISYFAGDVIFHMGEEPQEPRMYFCLSGEGEYMHVQEGSQRVPPGDWMCEYCLWTQWTHHGSLRAGTQLTLVALHAQQFLEIACQFQTGEFFPYKYAQLFAVALNKIEKIDLTDLEDPKMCLDGLAEKAFDPSASYLFRRKTRMTLAETEESDAILQNEVSEVMAGKTYESHEGTSEVEHREGLIPKIAKSLSNLSLLARSNTNMSLRDTIRSTTRSTRDTTRSTARWTNVLSDEIREDDHDDSGLGTCQSVDASERSHRSERRSADSSATSITLQSHPLDGYSTPPQQRLSDSSARLPCPPGALSIDEGLEKQDEGTNRDHKGDGGDDKQDLA